MLKDIAVGVMAVVVIGFCAFGFGSKFVEFVYLVRSDDPLARDGIFAVAPLSNYLLASAGFLCLLGWATIHGMFHNIERPKHTMLVDDERLDAADSSTPFSNSVIQ
ncbi:MAG: hypothetical protein AAGA92_10335 [Planctomycetota bacterium]